MSEAAAGRVRIMPRRGIEWDSGIEAWIRDQFVERMQIHRREGRDAVVQYRYSLAEPSDGAVWKCWIRVEVHQWLDGDRRACAAGEISVKTIDDVKDRSDYGAAEAELQRDILEIEGKLEDELAARIAKREVAGGG